jgi:YggT family protein
MVPLIGFLVLVIDLYIWVVIASAILSWLIAFNVVNTSNRFVYSVAETLYRLTEPALRPIRGIIPNLGGIDISPVILILFLLFIRDVVLLGWILPAVAPGPLFERASAARASPSPPESCCRWCSRRNQGATNRRHRAFGGEAV